MGRIAPDGHTMCAYSNSFHHSPCKRLARLVFGRGTRCAALRCLAPHALHSPRRLSRTLHLLCTYSQLRRASRLTSPCTLFLSIPHLKTSLGLPSPSTSAHTSKFQVSLHTLSQPRRPPAPLPVGPPSALRQKADPHAPPRRGRRWSIARGRTAPIWSAIDCARASLARDAIVVWVGQIEPAYYVLCLRVWWPGQVFGRCVRVRGFGGLVGRWVGGRR